MFVIYIQYVLNKCQIFPIGFIIALNIVKINIYILNILIMNKICNLILFSL